MTRQRFCLEHHFYQACFSTNTSRLTRHLYIYTSIHIDYLDIYFYVCISDPFVCLSVYQSIHPSIHLSICLSLHLCIYLKSCKCISSPLSFLTSISIYRSVCLSACRSAWLAVCRSIYVCMCDCMHACMHAYAYASMYVCMCLRMSICIYLNVYFWRVRDLCWNYVGCWPLKNKLHRHRPQIEKVGTDGSQRGNQRLPWQGTAGSQTLKLTVPNLGTRGYHCKELPVPRS